jgi:endonuclease YncB( thermonuclease family)
VQERDHPKFFDRLARLQISSFCQMSRLARGVLAETLAVALFGLLLSSQALAVEESPAGNIAIRDSASPALEAASPHAQDAQTPKQATGPAHRAETGSGDIAVVLSLLVTSSERRQLAGELERLLRQGKPEAAEHRLNTAVEVGSLAVLLLDRLGDPNFLAGLQALGIRGEDHPIQPSTVTNDPLAINGSSNAHAMSAASELADLKEAKERERQRADAVARELATAREDIHNLQALREQEVSSALANVAKLAELTEALEQEREWVDAITRKLATVTEERRALQTQRERDATLIASNLMELKELKEASEHERQPGRSGGELALKTGQALEGGIAGPGTDAGTTGLAPVQAPSSTSSIAVPEAAAVEGNTGRLRGVPDVVNASTLSLQGRLIRLFGIETAGETGSADDLAEYLKGREVVCEPADSTDRYRCQVDGKDLSLVVLFNGGGRVASDATSELKTAAERARSAGIGVWSR